MNFIIDGEIDEKVSQEFMSNVLNLEEGETIDITISSEGGCVIDGNVIVSKIRELSKQGHKTTAHVVSIAASMASVIACACDSLILDSNAFLMIHQVWATVAGNADDLRKEADTLDLFTKSLISIYRTKFDLTDDEIMSLLKDETWILGEQAKQYGLNCTVNDVGEDLDVAAKLVDFKKKFNRVIKNMKSDTPMEKEEIKEETSQEKEVVEQEETTVEQPEEVKDPMAEEEFMEPEEETKEEQEQQEPLEENKDEEDEDVEALKKKCAELEEEVEKLRKELEEPTDKRVSGMQAKMQLKINDCEHKYKDLIEVKDKEIKLRDEELESIKAEATSLKSKLDESMKNCEDLASALRNKDSALESLNARVLSPAETPTKKTWRDLEGKEFFDYLKKNNNIIKITKQPNK